MKSKQVPFWQREYFSAGYKIAFLNAIHLRLQAGESIGRALVSVIRAERNPNKQRDMAPAVEALDQGETVPVAFARLDFFDQTILAILKAGERSGMAGAIATAAGHLMVRQTWFRQHALVIFILANELLSVALAPVMLYQEILPWIREHISPPSNPAALLQYQQDMALAEQMTFGLMGLVVVVGFLAVWWVFQINRQMAPAKLQMFFADGAMGVGFKLASAMLKAGVTVEQVAQDLARNGPGWSRRFWLAVHRDLQRAIEPAEALLQKGLYLEEKSLLASHVRAKQLGDVLSVLAEDRERKAKRGRDLLLLGGTMLTVSFILLCLGVAIWIYVTYDNTLSAGLEALGNGF